jgi:hypothetical protein
VERIIGTGDEPASGQIPFTPRGKKVLELSLREALYLGHNHIGTEHILLGLAREGRGVATRILLDLETDAEKIRNEVIRVLGGSGAPFEPIAPLAPDLRRRLPRPPGRAGGSARDGRTLQFLAGGATFGVALGLGILIGRLIWG